MDTVSGKHAITLRVERPWESHAGERIEFRSAEGAAGIGVSMAALDSGDWLSAVRA